MERRESEKNRPLDRGFFPAHLAVYSTIIDEAMAGVCSLLNRPMRIQMGSQNGGRTLVYTLNVPACRDLEHGRLIRPRGPSRRLSRLSGHVPNVQEVLVRGRGHITFGLSGSAVEC